MLPDNSVDRSEPHARTLASLLGRKKWLENMLAHLGAHSRAGVGNRKHRVGSGDHSGIKMAERIVQDDHLRFDFQYAAVRHRIPRVQAEVHQHLLHLRGLRLQGLQIPRHHPDFDIFSNHLVQKAHQGLNDLVQLNGARWKRLAAGYTKQLPLLGRFLVRLTPTSSTLIVTSHAYTL